MFRLERVYGFGQPDQNWKESRVSRMMRRGNKFECTLQMIHSSWPHWANISTKNKSEVFGEFY